jgi:transposase
MAPKFVAFYRMSGYGKALVAVAAKNARMAWAMLSEGEALQPLGASA